MAVHVWTFRAENEFLPDDLKSGTDPAAHGDLPAEIERYLARGIDGFFVDFPAIGVWSGTGLRTAPVRRFRGNVHESGGPGSVYISAVQPEHQPLTDTSLPGNKLHGR